MSQESKRRRFRSRRSTRRDVWRGRAVGTQCALISPSTKPPERDSVSATTAAPDASSRPRAPGILLGRSHPTTTVAGLETNTLWDRIFHGRSESDSGSCQGVAGTRSFQPCDSFSHHSQSNRRRARHARARLTSAGIERRNRWNRHGREAAGLPSVSGASRTRTDDLLGAIQALSQLSYSPARPSLASHCCDRLRARQDQACSTDQTFSSMPDTDEV